MKLVDQVPDILRAGLDRFRIVGALCSCDLQSYQFEALDQCVAGNARRALDRSDEVVAMALGRFFPGHANYGSGDGAETQ